jgi:hypothetical protein
MVLVQEDDSHDEHVIYYLSRSLTTTETKYFHVEKLALVSIQVVHRFSSLYLVTHNQSHFRCNTSLLDNCWGENTPNG